MFLIGILENALKNTEQNRIYALKKLKKWKKLKKIGWPPKKCVFEFWKKNLTKFCTSHFLSFKNNRHTNVLLVSIFENALKKAINLQKNGHNGVFVR